jgi:uncharacterized membrane protein
MRYSIPVSRLDDIVARNEARKKMTARRFTLIGVAVLVVVVTILMLFTDLGQPKRTPPARVDHVDGVKLLRGR